MNIITIVVIVFGFLAVVGFVLFAILKLKGLWTNLYLLGNKESTDPCRNDPHCNILKEMNSEFLERRNEFWQGLGQHIIITIGIITLTVLLLEEKIPPEAALPIIAGLCSFAAGKSISTIRNNIVPKNTPPTEKKTEQQ